MERIIVSFYLSQIDTCSFFPSYDKPPVRHFKLHMGRISLAEIERSGVLWSTATDDSCIDLAACGFVREFGSLQAHGSLVLVTDSNGRILIIDANQTRVLRKINAGAAGFDSTATGEVTAF